MEQNKEPYIMSRVTSLELQDYGIKNVNAQLIIILNSFSYFNEKQKSFFCTVAPLEVVKINVKLT